MHELSLPEAIEQISLCWHPGAPQARRKKNRTKSRLHRSFAQIPPKDTKRHVTQDPKSISCGLSNSSATEKTSPNRLRVSSDRFFATRATSPRRLSTRRVPPNTRHARPRRSGLAKFYFDANFLANRSAGVFHQMDYPYTKHLIYSPSGRQMCSYLGMCS